MKIYPMPCEYREGDGFFVFSDKITIKYNEDFPHARTLPLLCELWRNFTGGMCEAEFVRDNMLARHSVSVGGVVSLCEAGYEYSVSVTKSGFGACAEGHIGLIRAFMTLLQAIQPERVNNKDFKKFHIACCEISDRPALAMRAIHLAFSRKEGGLEALRQGVRMCALVKYSHVLVEVDAQVRLDALGDLAFSDAVSKEEIADVFDEARALGLELIPMYNSFGHVYADNVVKHQAWFEPDGRCFCMSNPRVKRLLREVALEMIELCGEGGYLHIGGDEAHAFGTCDVCKKTPTERLYADFINEMAELAKPLGRRVMIWGDTMLEHDRFRSQTDAFGREYIASEGTPERGYLALDLLDKSVVICDWQYHTWEETVRTSAYFASKGFSVIPCSANEVDNATNTDAMCNAAKKYGYHGYMQTIWRPIGYQPVLIVRGATSAWMGDTSGYNRFAAGEFEFLREYKLMANRSGDLMRKVAPSVVYPYSNNGCDVREGSFLP